MYKKLLKLLQQGKAVYAEVDSIYMWGGHDRFRLVTPQNCEFTWLDTQNFNSSCFLRLSTFKNLPISPQTIVESMEAYDHIHHLKITKLQVIA